MIENITVKRHESAPGLLLVEIPMLRDIEGHGVWIDPAEARRFAADLLQCAEEAERAR